MLETKQIDAYLKRIGYEGDKKPTGENLRALQYAHLLTVPYENLDIVKGKRISLEIPKLYEKVVVEGRGGYCFELNKLFSHLLSGLGYRVTDYVARYFRYETIIPKRRHQVIRARCEDGQEFLCDVGVGAVIPLWPIPYRTGEVFDQEGILYALREDAVYGKVLIEPHGEGWRDVYSFTEEPQLEPDFIFASFWCEFAPESPFNKQYIVSIRQPGKRITIDGYALREFSSKGVEEKTMTEQEREQVLEDVFGIKL